MKRKQPIFPPGKRPAPETFEILYPPTEDGHLTEQQKKWPVVTEEWTREELEAIRQQRQAQQQPPTN
jgi:hypothetical protein